MDDTENSRDPLTDLLNAPVKGLERQIVLLERQIVERRALNLQIQASTETDIENQRRQMWRLRYSPDPGEVKHHREMISRLRQQQAIENTAAWKDVTFLERERERLKGDLEKRQSTRSLIEGE